MKVLLTGSGGFLGWHTRLRLHATTENQVVAIDRSRWSELGPAVASADAIIHIAGANRGTEQEIQETNVRLAHDVAAAVTGVGKPMRVVLAGTIQAGGDTAYGQSKAAAARIIGDAAARAGGEFVDIELPNLFGEHARPNYNSFVATFIDHTIMGTQPQIADRRFRLLHAQAAAQFLIDGLTGEAPAAREAVTEVGIGEVWELLQEFHSSYASGEIPDLSTPLRIDLFNSYRAALFPARYPIRLVPHDDPRGRFVETIRVRGGEGQSSISTTVPGITRGEHYHLHKIERFAVLEGEATICLRRMFSDEIVTFEVTGEQPTAIDMPTGWVHNITNVGHGPLLTQFWSHELFRPDAPDTYAEPVGCTHVENA